MATEKKNEGGILLLLLALLGIFFLLKKNNNPGPMGAYDDAPIQLRPLQPRADEEYKQIEEPGGGKRYHNNETWDIEWTPDGLPGKVVIHRDAVQT